MALSPGRTLSIALLALGCAAGPRPSPRPAPAVDLAPESWADSLDEMVFGPDLAPAPSPPAAPGASPEEPSRNDRAGSAPLGGPGGESRVEAARLARLPAGEIRGDRLEEAAQLLEAAVEAESGPDRAPVPQGREPSSEPGSEPGNKVLYLRALGDALLGLGRDREAAKAYEDAAAEAAARPRDPRPGSGDAAGSTLHGNLAVAYYRLGDAGRAREAAERALALEPGYPEAVKTLGLVDLAAGRIESGERRLADALAASPRIPEAILALAELDEASGRFSQAAERYRKLLDLSADAGAADGHRRWRSLFRSSPTRRGAVTRQMSVRAIEDELRARLSRLEAPAGLSVK